MIQHIFPAESLPAENEIKQEIVKAFITCYPLKKTNGKAFLAGFCLAVITVFFVLLLKTKVSPDVMSIRCISLVLVVLSCALYVVCYIYWGRKSGEAYRQMMRYNICVLVFMHFHFFLVLALAVVLTTKSAEVYWNFLLTMSLTWTSYLLVALGVYHITKSKYYINLIKQKSLLWIVPWIAASQALLIVLIYRISKNLSQIILLNIAFTIGVGMGIFLAQAIQNLTHLKYIEPLLNDEKYKSN